MSRKKTVKKTTSKKRKKSGNKIFGGVLIAFCLIAVVAAYLFTPLGKIVDGILFGENGDREPSGGNGQIAYETDELAVHFLELGNKYAGDCVLIDIGDTEILIDAGSRASSAATIVPYVQNYCADNTLEYVIATHAHQDHIAGFVGTKDAPGVFESFAVGTIIDFSMTNATSAVYNNYLSAREQAIARGAEHYTALQCWNQTDGAKRTYSITEDISFSILYQRYYEEKSSDENNYSVCILLTQGTNHYLFTGDLEKEGEESLVESNSLPKCQLFKGGHHGSPTSSNDCLLSVIQPDVVCVCCCAGSDEYTSNKDNQFPSQAFIDRIKNYTDRVYVTSLCDESAEKGFVSFNGNIVVTSKGKELTVNCSNNNIPLKDTEWCKNNRKW